MEFLTENIGTIAIIAIALFVVIGLIKRTLWLCIVGVVIAAFLGISQPGIIDPAVEFVSSFFGGAVDPMKDKDYIDMVGEDNFTTPNNRFDDISENENNDK